MFASMGGLISFAADPLELMNQREVGLGYIMECDVGFE